MIKIFLVEDEIVIRDGIRNSIDWNREGYEFAGEASDGELAFPLIQKTHPDIVITDIRMPFMDGLELSRLVKKEFPDIKIIILSGYDDFEYAKEALKLGATDYLVKPVAAAKLLEAISSVAEKIEEEQEQRRYLETFEKEKRENAIFAKQKLFDAVITGSRPVSELIDESRKLGIDLVSNRYNILLFQIYAGEETEEYSETLNTVTAAIRDMARQYKNAEMIEHGPEGFAFILKETGDMPLDDALKDFSQKMISLVQSYPGIEYFGGIGTDIGRLSEMGKCYEEASRAFAYRYLKKRNSIADSREEIPGAITDAADDSLQLSSLQPDRLDRRVIISFLNIGQPDEVPHFINEYFDSIGKENVQSRIFRQYIAMDMYVAAITNIRQLGYTPDDLLEQCGDFQKMIASASTVEQTKEQLNHLFRTVLSMRDNVLQKKNSFLLKEAEEYIRSNYAREDMSLNTAAASVNLSPNHFCSLFSQEEGQTFIEFLTSVRMKKAKELLRSTNMKTTEIAFAVGYRDPHYFSYLFKKTQDCTPREFRSGSEGQGDGR